MFRQAGRFPCSQEGHPLTSFPPLQSSHTFHRGYARRRSRQRLAFDESTLRHDRSLLRPATRSPGSSSLEVLFPFSAINAVSPFLDVGQPRLLAVYETPATGFPHPRHFHLQGFSPSWRLSPHSTSPVCFARQALMGFRACQSTSSHAACHPKTARPPHRLLRSRANPQPESRNNDTASLESPLTARHCFQRLGRPTGLIEAPPLQGSSSLPWQRFPAASSSLARPIRQPPKRLCEPAGLHSVFFASPANQVRAEARCCPTESQLTKSSACLSRTKPTLMGFVGQSKPPSRSREASKSQGRNR